MHKLANLLAPMVEIIESRRMTLGLLDTFVGHRISERILHGQVKRGDGDRIEAAFWYSDLRNFTHLSETLPTHELLELLNEYFDGGARGRFRLIEFVDFEHFFDWCDAADRVGREYRPTSYSARPAPA